VLPVALRRFFWDVDAGALDLERHARFVIERLLEHGDDEAVAWLRARYDRAALAAVLRSSRSLDRKTARFWQAVLEIPESGVRCLREPPFPPRPAAS